MSASRDKGQRIAFVYSNLYEIYRKGKEAAKAADTSRVFRAPAEAHPGLTRRVDTARVLRAGDAHAPEHARVKAYSPVNLISKRLEAAHLAARVEAAARAPQHGHAHSGDTLKARIEAVRSERAEAETPRASSSAAVRDLKDNLKSLTDLHSRLRFMLLELEDLVKE